MLLATFLIVREVPSTYESRAVLVIVERATKDAEAMSARISVARQQAISTQNLQAIVDRHHLKDAVESREAAVKRLRDAIKIEMKLSDYYPQFPETLTLSYRHKYPEL